MINIEIPETTYILITFVILIVIIGWEYTRKQQKKFLKKEAKILKDGIIKGKYE